MEVTFDKKLADAEELSAVNEWILTPLEKGVACDDTELHSTLLRYIDTLIRAQVGEIGTIKLEILQVVALVEVLFLVKHTMFSNENGIMEMWGSDPFTFTTCYSDKVGSLMKPVIHTITIVSTNHVQNTVVNIKGSTVTFIKEKDELPN